MRLVVDASAAVLRAQDPDHDQRAAVAHEAFSLAAESYLLEAPPLLGWEVCQVVHRKRPAEWASLRARQQVVNLVLDGIELVNPGEIELAVVGALAESHSLSAYDAAYLARAQVADALLLTEDARLGAAGARALGKPRVHSVASLRQALS